MTHEDLKLILDEISKVNDNVNRIDIKVDSTNKDLYEIKNEVKEIKIEVKHHIRRSDLLEGVVALLEKKLEPVESWVKTFGNMFKIFGFVSAAVACFSGIYMAVKALMIFVK